jgi:hypothetical protein
MPHRWHTRSMTATPTVLSVNAGLPRTVNVGGTSVTTAIWKEPVGGPITVRGVNLAGDGQTDRWVHGGVDKAVYAYSDENYDWWESELGRALGPGTFGENLTVAGLDPSAALIGERCKVGSALLEVSEPRFPCFKLGIRMQDSRFLKLLRRRPTSRHLPADRLGRRGRGRRRDPGRRAGLGSRSPSVSPPRPIWATANNSAGSSPLIGCLTSGDRGSSPGSAATAVPQKASVLPDAPRANAYGGDVRDAPRKREAGLTVRRTSAMRAPGAAAISREQRDAALGQSRRAP